MVMGCGGRIGDNEHYIDAGGYTAFTVHGVVKLNICCRQRNNDGSLWHHHVASGAVSSPVFLRPSRRAIIAPCSCYYPQETPCGVSPDDEWTAGAGLTSLVEQFPKVI